jgi:hypothetical protein
MRQMASIMMLVAVVLSACIWVPGDRGGRGYYGGPQRGYGGGDRDGWGDRGRGEHHR